jgi:co-chaperonin GroES (HSP10)
MSTTPKAKPPSSKLPFPFRPNGSTVLAQVLDVQETFKGDTSERAIVIPNPNHACHDTVRAEVVAVGNENKNCKVGDILMIHKMVGNEILLQGQPFKVVRAEDIVGFYE